MTSKYPELTPQRIADALAGDRAAIAELYRCYGLRVRASVATAIRFRPELASYLDDIVSEVWVRVLADGCRPLRTYDAGRGPFGYYLRMRTWAMARMVAGQILRRARLVELDDPFVSLFAEDGLEGRLLGRDELERLYQAVRERLDAVDLAIFERVYVEGRQIDEVGQALGLRKDAAYRRSHRLRAKIQKIADEVMPPAEASRPLAVLVAFVAIAEHLSDFPCVGP